MINVFQLLVAKHLNSIDMCINTTTSCMWLEFLFNCIGMARASSFLTVGDLLETMLGLAGLVAIFGGIIYFYCSINYFFDKHNNPDEVDSEEEERQFQEVQTKLDKQISNVYQESSRIQSEINFMKSSRILKSAANTNKSIIGNSQISCNAKVSSSADYEGEFDDMFNKFYANDDSNKSDKWV